MRKPPTVLYRIVSRCGITASADFIINVFKKSLFSPLNCVLHNLLEEIDSFIILLYNKTLFYYLKLLVVYDNI